MSEQSEPAEHQPRPNPPDELEAPPPTANSPRLAVCDLCGHEMYEWHCRIVCPACGYQRDCSDP